MAHLQPHKRGLSRRDLLKNLSVAPLLFRSSGFSPGAFLNAGSGFRSSPPFSFADVRYAPHYPVRSPLDDVLRLVAPGSDEYATEKYAAEIALVLERWSEGLRSGDLSGLRPSLDVSLRASSLVAVREMRLRSDSGIETVRREFSPGVAAGQGGLLGELADWVGKGVAIERVEFELTALDETSKAPLMARSTVRYSMVARRGDERREQRVGTWRMDWVRGSGEDASGLWRVSEFVPETEARAVVRGGFIDVTEAAFGATESYRAQMLPGVDEWRTRLDGACGIDVYGNNGVAAGDFDGDGWDDLYVCQPAGLPNRLYRNRGDGTFEDVTERAGVGVLDNTACALFADFRNIGRQDLLVVCGNGPLLFLNGNDGTFALKHDAFQFARPPQGTFTHAALADYDGDGRLDVYFCLYSYYLGLDQYHYPAPYFDARNGPPNFLLHNEGDGRFADRTEAAGLNADNDRYSFACAWGHAGESESPDLSVVNDFGRNNLYRSNGDGTFRSAAQEAHVEDVGAGMSASWGDTGNRGRSDLYVANMWSAAGQRVSQVREFHPKASEGVRELYRRHARGNALYRNEGNGRFTNVSEAAGVDMGRWAWCSDFWDFDQDGYLDLYITNGYITALAPDRLSTTAALPGAAAGATADLSSFFWRQVVGRSPEDATPSLTYERGWNALNELIRSDNSWSGSERNVMLANNRDGTFTEVSGAVGLDLLEDGRSFALADLDGDGRIEVVVKNRNAPQLRVMRNALPDLGDSIAFRLRGTKSNRDAIGAAVTLTVGELRQTRYVQAGSGFLAQHSKELLFGIGKGPGSIEVRVRWPSGLTQTFRELPRNCRVELVEGEATFAVKAFTAESAAYRKAEGKTPPVTRPLPTAVETWLLDRLPAPPLTLPDLAGTMHALAGLQGGLVLLHFWATTAPTSREQLRVLERHRKALADTSISVLAINVDQPDAASAARAAAEMERVSYPVLFATDEVAGLYNILYRYLFDRRANLAIPSAFLIDRDGMIVKVYQGAFAVETLLADARSMPTTAAERVHKGLPFAGTLHRGEFARNDFTLGVAMFQHGYYEQAAVSFEQVVAARPNDPEAHYNLGTLNLRRNNFAEARRYLQQTLTLKPDYPEAWNNLGMMAAQDGRPDEAIADFQKSLALRPTYATALLNLGNVYRHQRSFVAARESLTSALNLQPDDPEANYSLGMLYAQQNEMQQAADYLRQAIALRPDYPEALNNLGVLLVREQEYARAEEQFQTCIRLVPGFDQSYLNLASLYLVLHEKEKARSALEELLRQHPESAAARRGMETLDAAP